MYLSEVVGMSAKDIRAKGINVDKKVSLIRKRVLRNTRNSDQSYVGMTNINNLPTVGAIHPINHFNPPMAKGGGGEGVDATPPTGFSNFSQKWKELFLQTFAHEKIFQIGPAILALKLDKGRVLGGSGNQDDIQS